MTSETTAAPADGDALLAALRRPETTPVRITLHPSL